MMRITETFALQNTTSELADNDIRAFLAHELSRLAAQKGLKNWPTSEQLDLLRDRAARHFAYAVATVKYLGNTPRMPSKRYAVIERSREDTIHEGRVEGVHRGLSLDSLCTSIVQVSFAHNNPEENAVVRSVLAAALFTPPFSPSAIHEAVQAQTGELEVKEVMNILESVHSLLELREDPDHPVRPFHKLLSDCLTNPSRCTDERFLITKDSVDVSI